MNFSWALEISRLKNYATMLLALSSGLLSQLALADESPRDGLFDSAALYAGQGVDHNLPELPGRILGGDIDWEKSYFAGVGLSKTIGTLGESIEYLQDKSFGAIRHGYELVVVKHHGLQDNLEAGAAYVLRTPDAHLGLLGVNFSAGVGLSYAFDTPTYEDGPEDDPDERYRLQLLALFELEWRLRGVEQLSFVTRIHHRSGVYGIIAPPHVGSNFLVAGVRWEF